MRRAAVALLLAGCGERGPDDCGGDLRGIWRDGARAVEIHPGAGRWEIFFVGDDRPHDLPIGMVAGPGVIDLDTSAPDGSALTGWFTRRYERAARICFVQTLATLRDCRGGRAELELRPPPPPADLDACARAEEHLLTVDAPAELWSLVRD